MTVERYDLADVEDPADLEVLESYGYAAPGAARGGVDSPFPAGSVERFHHERAGTILDRFRDLTPRDAGRASVFYLWAALAWTICKAFRGLRVIVRACWSSSVKREGVARSLGYLALVLLGLWVLWLTVSARTAWTAGLVVFLMCLAAGALHREDHDTRRRRLQAERAEYMRDSAAIRWELAAEALRRLDQQADPSAWRPFTVTAPWPLDPDPDPDRVPLGVERDGAVVDLDLRDVHVLVGGASGGGKSQMIRTLALGAMARGAAVYLFTAKAPTRQRPDDYAALRSGCAGYGAGPDHMAALADTLERLERDLPVLTGRTVVVVDEVTDAMGAPGVGRRIASSLAQLARRGRSSDLVLILGVQRPTKDGIPPQVLANMPVRIAMRAATPADTRVILGEDAEDRGMVCHKWRPKVDAGMAWVSGLETDDGEPVLVRGWQVPDSAARRALSLYRAPAVVDGELLEPTVETAAVDEVVLRSGQDDGAGGVVLPFRREAVDEVDAEVVEPAAVCAAPSCSKALTAEQIARGRRTCSPAHRTAAHRARQRTGGA